MVLLSFGSKPSVVTATVTPAVVSAAAAVVTAAAAVVIRKVHRN